MVWGCYSSQSFAVADFDFFGLISRYLYWFGRKLDMIVAAEGKHFLMSIFSYDLVRER